MSTEQRYHEKGRNDFVFAPKKVYHFEPPMEDSLTTPALKKWHRAGWESANIQAEKQGANFYLQEALKYIENNEIDRNKMAIIIQKANDSLKNKKEVAPLSNKLEILVEIAMNEILRILPVGATKFPLFILQIILESFADSVKKTVEK